MVKLQVGGGCHTCGGVRSQCLSLTMREETAELGLAETVCSSTVIKCGQMTTGP